MPDVLELVTPHFFDINNNKLTVISRRGQTLLTERKRADSYRNNDPEPRHRDTSDGALLPMRDVSEPLERLSVQFITSLKYL